MKSSKIQQLIIVIAIVAFIDVVSIAVGQTSTTTTTTTTTEGTKSTTVGTITEYTPGQTIVVKTSDGAKSFKISGDTSLTKTVTVGSSVQIKAITGANGVYATTIVPTPDVAGPDYQPPPKKN